MTTRTSRPSAGSAGARRSSARATRRTASRCSTRRWSRSRPARCHRSCRAWSTARSSKRVTGSSTFAAHGSGRRRWIDGSRRNPISSCSAVSACCTVPSCCFSTAPGRAAADEARRAHEWLVGPPPEPEVGEALYQQGELHRLVGRSADAETAYRAASRAGRRPEPGLCPASTGAGTDRRGGRFPPAGARRDPRPPGATAIAGRVRRSHACGGRRSRRLVTAPRSWRRSRARPVRPCWGPWRPGRTARSSWPAGEAQGSLAALRRCVGGVAGPRCAIRVGAGQAAHRAVLSGARRRGHGSDGVRGRRRGVPGARSPAGIGRGGRTLDARGAARPGGLTGREDRGAPARRYGQDQPRHRGRAGDQREDGRPAREQHPHEARPPLARRARPRSRTSTSWSDRADEGRLDRNTHVVGCRRLVRSADASTPSDA